MPRQQRWLEGEQAQHMVGAAGDRLDPARTPGPDRRTDEVDRLDAGRPQARLEAQVEVGRVDADEGVRSCGQQAIAKRVADAFDLAVVAQHLDIAAYGQLVVRPPGLEALSRHARAADADQARVRPALPHPAEQQSGEQVAGSLASDQRQFHVSGRCRASKPPGSRAGA
jgi:hypothetical protein